MAQAIIVTAILAGLVALLLVAYYKGKKDERSNNLQESVDDLIESKKKQEKREAEHDKRVRHISDGPVTIDDAERMLQEWPDKATSAPKTNDAGS
jgi:hypothetical protein